MPFPLIGIGAVAGAKAAAPAIASIAGGVAKFLKKKGVRKAIKTARDVRDVVRAAEPAINQIAQRKSVAADALGAAPPNNIDRLDYERPNSGFMKILFWVAIGLVGLKILKK